MQEEIERAIGRRAEVVAGGSESGQLQGPAGLRGRERRDETRKGKAMNDSRSTDMTMDEVKKAMGDMARQFTGREYPDVILMTEAVYEKIKAQEISSVPHGIVDPTTIYGFPFERYPTMKQVCERALKLKSKGRKILVLGEFDGQTNTIDLSDAAEEAIIRLGDRLGHVTFSETFRMAMSVLYRREFPGDTFVAGEPSGKPDEPHGNGVTARRDGP